MKAMGGTPATHGLFISAFFREGIQKGYGD
jgi:hypothetical protein